MMQIPGYPAYYATEAGEIYSTISSKLLAQGVGSNGRPMVGLRYAKGKYRTVYVHVAVCEAFHGPRPEGLEVSHLDGDMLNNCPDNLRWETRSQNFQRRKDHGTDDRGLNNSRACMTTEKLEQVRTLRASGMTHAAIAAKLGVSRTTVSRILNGLRYV
ncbi:MAG: HNH endonuclease [Actinobacteria bacterium]|nr:HNH endonuclease [Actinomycetota bacterium]